MQLTRVAETPEYEVFPRFSPDGRQLVYTAGVPGDRADHVFVRPVAGGPARQVTRADANDCDPSFSPDGSMIVFARDKTYVWGGLAANWAEGGVICVVASDGSTERQLTADGVFAVHPEFSADGKMIVFAVPIGDGRASVPVDGSAAMTRIPGPSGAILSPDRTRIAFSKGEYSHETRIYVANADGTDVRLVTRDLAGCRRPVFSRTGDRLYFFRIEWIGDIPKFSVWETILEASSTRQLADNQLFDNPLGWQPGNAR